MLTLTKQLFLQAVLREAVGQERKKPTRFLQLSPLVKRRAIYFLVTQSMQLPQVNVRLKAGRKFIKSADLAG